MRIPNVYIEQSLSLNESLTLSDEAFRHVSKVLRMRVGDRVKLFNGRGGWYLAEIESSSKKQTSVRIVEHCPGLTETKLEITLVQGISRAQHMDYTLQKSVEMGVTRIVPVQTDYGNVKLDQERRDNKRRHWQKIIIGACEQSGRDTLPELLEPMALESWFEQEQNKHRFLLQPESGQSLSDVKPEDNKLSLIIGPEGGFSESEIGFLLSKECEAVSMGPRILRTETAALASITACQILWGDMA